MGKKGPMPSYKTIDDYIAAQKPEAQTILQELRNIINEAVPDVVEVENYKVPTFILVKGSKREHYIMIAAYAKFVSFYPSLTAMEAFADQLNDYKLGKGTIQFPFNKPIPKDLIVKMVQFRRNEITL